MTVFTPLQNRLKKTFKRVNLFDVYEGSNLPEGKKYALSFIIQDILKL
jgi:phenylalanyl-tRNA synthetase beta chain